MSGTKKIEVTEEEAEILKKGLDAVVKENEYPAQWSFNPEKKEKAIDEIHKADKLKEKLK